jgi:hypothetical protein
VVASRLMNLAWIGFGGLVEGTSWHPSNTDGSQGTVSAS